MLDANPLARPVALGVVWRGDEVLLGEAFDAVKGQVFYRPFGGTIEFGELGADAVVREFMEELGVEMRSRRYLGTLENLFTFEGSRGHELVRIYELEPVDAAFLSLDEPPVIDQPGVRLACWRVLGALDAPLYPEGLGELLAP